LREQRVHRKNIEDYTEFCRNHRLRNERRWARNRSEYSSLVLLGDQWAASHPHLEAQLLTGGNVVEACHATIVSHTGRVTEKSTMHRGALVSRQLRRHVGKLELHCASCGAIFTGRKGAKFCATKCRQRSWTEKQEAPKCQP
jgi:hypothetical protein